ncbi:MAG: RNA-directed DNA polymerase [Rhizorhabdus sp.]|jgi:hypothetical protein|nr:MAG: RNA-directed DNA polymerase [Rhizorhabdus sp.]
MPNAERMKALLAKAYFPKELPQPFTTEDFGQHAGDILEEWEKSKLFKKEPSKITSKKMKRGSYSYKLDSAEIEVISTPKRGYERRDIHVTHPLPQALLYSEMSNGWKEIQKWLLRQRFSLDEIRIASDAGRAIKGINFPLHKAKKNYIEATSDWLVKTDITRFYPSIYTHSIPWAAYGKERVKSDLKLYQGSLGDRLDVLVRACNRNQTVGLPIGPESSRILAEVISARIDDDFSKLQERITPQTADRLQDDWFLGLKTFEESESALASIISVYRTYGLEINGSKTSVSRVVAHAEEAWISELGSFLSHRSGPLKGSRLKEFLTLSLRLQVENERSAVTNYALSVLENNPINKDDIDILESFLLKAALISPGSMSRICELLINLGFKTSRISKSRIGSRFIELAERNLANGNTYEVIWQIYTLRGLNIALNSRNICETMKYYPSSAIALILLDMESKGLCARRLPKDTWEQNISKEKVRTDWIWLLAYEGIRHGWLRDTSGVMADSLFAPLSKRNIVFYDPRRNVPKTEKTVKIRAASRRKNVERIARFMLDIRGLGEEEEDEDY